MFPHLIECEQAFVLDCLGDDAFAHAVATAHLVGVFHRNGAGVALVPNVANVRFAEHQMIANLVHVFAFTQQLEIPRAIDRVAIQTSTDQLVVLNHQSFVNATHRVRQRDVLGTFAALKITSAE